MPRRKTPTLLRELRGTSRPSRLPLNEPKPEGALVDPPEHFDDELKAIWAYAIRHSPPGLLRLLDSSILEVWCIAQKTFRRAARELSATPSLVDKSPNGYDRPHPLLSVMNRQSTVMLQAAAQMGFSPVSRARISIDPAKPANPWEAIHEISA